MSAGRAAGVSPKPGLWRMLCLARIAANLPHFRRYLARRGEETCIVDLVIDRAPMLDSEKRMVAGLSDMADRIAGRYRAGIFSLCLGTAPDAQAELVEAQAHPAGVALKQALGQRLDVAAGVEARLAEDLGPFVGVCS